MVKKIEPLVNIGPEGDATEEATTPLPSEDVNALNTEEAEFRALRRDLPGVRGTSAVGIVAIAVGKVPGRKRIFPHPSRISADRTDRRSRSGNGEAVFCGRARHRGALTASASRCPIAFSTLRLRRAERFASYRCDKPTPMATKTSITGPRKSA